MFCTKCGENLPSESRFCPACGEEILTHSSGLETNQGAEGYPSAVRKLIQDAEAGDKEAMLDLALWFRDSGDSQSASHWFAEHNRLDLKGALDFSAIAAAVARLNPEVQVGMLDESAPHAIRFGEDVLVIAGPAKRGLFSGGVQISVQRVNADLIWIRFVGDLGESTFEDMLFNARTRPLTRFGFYCQQFGERGHFTIAAPLKYSDPEFAAELACSLLDDVSSYLTGVAVMTPVMNSRRPTSVGEGDPDLGPIRAWLDNTGRSEVTIHATGSALLVSHPVHSLSLFTYEFDGVNGEEITEFGQKIYQLAENMAFQDSGLGLAVDYKDFGLALQIALPLNLVNIEIVSEYVGFLELAAQKVANT